MNPLSGRRLNPWEPVPRHGCRECDGPGEYLISSHVGTPRVSERDGVATVSAVDLVCCLACPAHADIARRSYQEWYGTALCIATRRGWAQWLRDLARRWFLTGEVTGP